MIRMLLALSFLVLIPDMAYAHSQGIAQSSFAEGLLHSLAGIDHLLAMLVVGFLAVQQRRSQAWVLPATFVASMSIGAGLAWINISLPFGEIGIVLSLLGLGSWLAFNFKPSLALSIGLVAAFAVFHGQAHGVEMPVSANPLPYGIGLMLMTAILHAVGIGISRLFLNSWGEKLAGSLTMVTGLVLLIQ